MSRRPTKNRLEIANIEHVISTFQDRQVDFYKGPFQILAELEEVVTFQDSPEERIFIPYKDEGDAIFDLKEIKPGRGGFDIHVYEFATTIS